MRRSIIFCLLVLFSLTASLGTHAGPTYMVLEQTSDGSAKHQPLNMSLLDGDAVDPVLHHIILNQPTDSATAQVLWLANEKPYKWVQGGADNDFDFVEYAILPDGSSIEYRIYLYQYDTELTDLRHLRTASDWRIDGGVLASLDFGQYRIEAAVRVPGRPEQTLSSRIDVIPNPDPNNATDPGDGPTKSNGDGLAIPRARFVDKPLYYLLGSGVDIRFEVDNFPAGADVLAIAWSDSAFDLISEFAHTQNEQPWAIASEKMNTLPVGVAELQLIVRTADGTSKTSHRVHIVDPNGEPDPDNGGGDPQAPAPADPAPPADDPVAPPPAPVGQAGDGQQPPANPGAIPVPDLGGAAIGFTTLTKSPNTRVIYVSNSQGNDSNDGLSEATPVKTLQHAKDLVRDGKPDWLLLKCGDVWENEHLMGLMQSGSSDVEPFVLSTYGEGARPLIIPPSGTHGIQLTGTRVNGVVIQGIHIYAATRDPASPKFVNRDGQWDGINVRLTSQDGLYVRSLVIEDCIVSHFDTNIEIVDDWPRLQKGDNGEATAGTPGRIKATLRRNIVQYASGTDSHSIGIYLEGTRDTVVEQNLVDHNGTAQSDGIKKRNKRSHNIYCQTFNGPITFRENIISRAGAHGLQLRAGGDIVGNLFVHNAMAFFTSLADSKANYNVILESVDIDPDVPENWRGFGIQGWGMDRYEVIGNIVARRLGTLERAGIDVSAKKLIVKNNIVYKWQSSETGKSIKLGAPETELSGNLTTDIATGQEPPYADPSRGVQSFAGSIGLEPTVESMINAIANRPRGVWVDEFAASTINDHVREGFQLK
ncbi:MAG: right-handed parallel beta-helix repeat-containing protein [Phycisphaeraceae bacterium]